MIAPYIVRLKNRPTIVIEHEYIKEPTEVEDTIMESLPDGVTQSDVISVTCFCRSCEIKVMTALLDSLGNMRSLDNMFDFDYLKQIFETRDNPDEELRQSQLDVLRASKAAVSMCDEIQAERDAS